MPNPPDKLTKLTQDALASLPGAPGSKQWRAAFETVIAKAHAAAYYAGLAERSAGGKARAWLAKFVGNAALSKAQRAELKDAIKAQLEYARAFADEAGDMSDAAVQARAGMYGSAVRTTYSAARYPGLPFHPGEGTECLTNCRCSWQDNGDGSFDWVLDAKESCATCLSRAAGSPYGGE